MTVTRAQLESEPWWGRETVPPAIDALADNLAAHYKVSRGNFGIRGDIAHLKGYHRSREWVLNSRFNTGGDYSVSRTSGDHSGGVVTDCCALDIQVPSAQLIAMCKRLDIAVRAGRLEKITEWYGTFGDDDRVDGYDNIANRVATSDSSHLWHLHLSFDRGAARNSHADIFNVLTGGFAVDPAQERALFAHQVAIAHRTMATLSNAKEARFRIPGETTDRVEPNALKGQLDRIEGKIDAIGNPTEIARAFAAAIVADPNVLAAILDAIKEEIQRVIDPSLFAETFLSTLKSKL